MLGNIDLNFSTNPSTATTTTASYTGSGFATISDSNGNLLFYVSQMGIYNKNHVSMGSEINAISPFVSAQSAIILPFPGNSNKYYVIWDTIFACLCGDGASSYYLYSIVDFTTNPLGELTYLGDVYVPGGPGEQWTNNSRFLADQNGNAVKNSGDFRPLTYAINAENDGYWVIVQNKNSIQSYEITSAGLNPNPVVSPVSGIYNSNYGNMFRVVPDYSNTNNFKLYGLQLGTQHFYSLDFNNSTGVFSNIQNINITTEGRLSGFEFSNDYKKVYFIRAKYNCCIDHGLNGDILVKDLTSLSTPSRQLYEYDNPSTVTINFSVIQKDRHGNLLVGSTFGTLNKNKYLHKIMNPDSFLTSSVKVNYIYLNGYELPDDAFYSQIAPLPQLIQKTGYYNCVENYTLSAPEINSSFLYKVSGVITTNNSYTINSGQNIIMRAEEAIYLEPNTDVKAGSTFLAEIQPCVVIDMRYGNFSQEYITEETFEVERPSALYPNPNNGTFEITLGTEPKGDVSVEVYDIYGKVIYRTVAKASTFAVDIPNLSAGVYLVKLSGTEVNESIKFIKQ